MSELLTLSGYTHYSDNEYGSQANMADGDLATYCQSMSHIAVDFVSGKIIDKIQIAVHNSMSLSAIVAATPYFQGSNDSTDGSNGTWTDLVQITSGNFGTPGSYPGYGDEISVSNTTIYRWYRLYPLTKTTSTVLNEWLMWAAFSGFIETPEISATTNTSVDLQISLAMPEAVSSVTASIFSVFAGVALEMPEILVAGSSSADLQISLAMPEAVFLPVAETDLQISLAMPWIESQLTPDCGVFIGTPIAIPEITLNQGCGCSVLLSVALPEIELVTGSETNFRILLDLPEISILPAGSMDDVVNFQTGDAIIRYFLTITGSADSTTDVDIPLESFQARRRSGNPTYLQAIVPSVDFVDYIADRPNGTMQISQGYELNGEVLQREIIIETEIERADTYQGGQNNSIVLIGYTTSTFSGKSITLDQATYRSSVNGKIHYRLAEPNIFLNPGDSVTIGTDTFTVGVMSYAISATTQQIEIEEA